MDGSVAHTWRMPHRPGLYGYLLDNGHLLYGGKIMEDLDRFEAWPRFKAGAVLEADWQRAGAVGGAPPGSPPRRPQAEERQCPAVVPAAAVRRDRRSRPGRAARQRSQRRDLCRLLCSR